MAKATPQRNYYYYYYYYYYYCYFVLAESMLLWLHPQCESRSTEQNTQPAGVCSVALFIDQCSSDCVLATGDASAPYVPDFGRALRGSSAGC
jgi:hypothetical protein